MMYSTTFTDLRRKCPVVRSDDSGRLCSLLAPETMIAAYKKSPFFSAPQFTPPHLDSSFLWRDMRATGIGHH